MKIDSFFHLELLQTKDAQIKEYRDKYEQEAVLYSAVLKEIQLLKDALLETQLKLQEAQVDIDQKKKDLFN